MAATSRDSWALPKPTKKEVGMFGAKMLVALLMFAAALYFWFTSQKAYGNTAGVAALVLAVFSALNMWKDGKKAGKPTAKGGSWVGWRHADGTPATDAELGQIVAGTIPAGLTPARINDGEEFPEGSTDVPMVTDWFGFGLERLLEVGIAGTVFVALMAHWPTPKPADGGGDPNAAAAPVDPVQEKLAAAAAEQKRMLDELRGELKTALTKPAPTPVATTPTGPAGTVPFGDDLYAKIERPNAKTLKLPKQPDGLTWGLQNYGGGSPIPLAAGTAGVTEDATTITYVSGADIPNTAEIYIVATKAGDGRAPSVVKRIPPVK